MLSLVIFILHLTNFNLRRKCCSKQWWTFDGVEDQTGSKTLYKILSFV